MELWIWLLLGGVVVLIVAVVAWWFLTQPSKPSICSQVACSVNEMPQGGPMSVPEWVISWSPPAQGAGQGYTVTYAGSIHDSQGRPILTFGPQSQTFVTLPDSVSGVVTVTVSATNQIGQGPPLTTQLTLQNEAPIVTSGNVQWPGLGYIILQLNGEFPDWPQNTPQPSTWTTQTSVKTASGTNVPITSQGAERQDDANGQHLIFNIFLATPPVPGDDFIVSYKLCHYNLCVSGQEPLNVPGVRPTAPTNLRSVFRV